MRLEKRSSAHDELQLGILVGGNLRIIVDGSTSAEEKVVDGLHLALELLSLAEDMELLGTKLEGLLTLGLAARQNDNVAAHGGGHLDGKVAEAANTHDGNSVSGLDAVLVENGPDRGTTAHQRSSVCGVDLIGDVEDAAGVENSAF
jgi:hypothetical protein